MKISIVPDNPMMYLGQRFAVQINISNCDSQILWVSAQIAGKVRSLKPSTESALKSIVHDALGAPQNAPYFGHVMSGSRLIATKFTPPKSFCAYLTADNIPPSYEGEGVSIAYELRFAAQITGRPVYSVSVPIRFIAPSQSHFDLGKAQSLGVFDIEAVIGESMPAPFALACPFKEQPNTNIEIARLNTSEHNIAAIAMTKEFNTGTEVTGVIDMKESTKRYDNVVVSLVRKEQYGDTGISEVSTIGCAKMCLRNTLMKRFYLPLPFQTPAEFATDMFVLSYSVEFRFGNENDADTLVWSTPIHVFPPKVSLSTPRTPTCSS